MKSLADKLDWEKQSLMPAIVQDMQTKQMHYFSRSKNRIWKKGESSGHIQHIKQCFIDCDNDSLLFLVEQVGGACHTGNASCFFKEITNHTERIQTQNLDSAHNVNYGILDTLYHTLLERKNADSNRSYTASLYQRGINTISKKIAEEAAEVIIALKDKDNAQIVYECADLIYHTLVALAYMNIHPDQVESELARRFSLSGIDEKESRKKE